MVRNRSSSTLVGSGSCQSALKRVFFPSDSFIPFNAAQDSPGWRPVQPTSLRDGPFSSPLHKHKKKFLLCFYGGPCSVAHPGHACIRLLYVFLCPSLFFVFRVVGTFCIVLYCFVCGLYYFVLFCIVLCVVFLIF